MGTTKWEAPAGPTTYETTDLNSLADGGNVLCDIISNDQTGELYLYMDLELYLNTQGSARDADARVEVYLLPTVDGTNYAYGDASTDPSQALKVGDFYFDAATTARRTIVRGILLPPEDFRFLVMNETGQAFASSGNTLKYIKYNIQT